MFELWDKFGKRNIAETEEKNGDDCYLFSALRRLHAKLLAAQPEFTEEDVIIIAYPSPGGSPTHSPSTSPRDRDADCEQDDSSWNAGGEKSSKSSTPKRGTGNGNVALTPPGQGSTSSKVTAIGTGKELTSRDFLALVRNFDEKALLRNRKAASDALNLLSDAYALTWRDKRYFTSATLMTSVGSSRLMAASARELGGRGNSSVLSTVRRPLFAPLSSFRAPTHKPPQNLVLLMGKCVESLLVYANESLSLRTMISSNVTLLRLLCFVCGESRKLESSSFGSGWRDIDEELNELVSHWQLFSVSLPLLVALQECYLLEFLLDAALPPTVCSSKYDGIALVLHEKKRRLMTEMMSSRTGFGSMTRGLPLISLAAIVSMSIFAEPKLRARVLDRMTGEGLLQTIRDELESTVNNFKRLLTGESDGQSPRAASCSPSKRSGGFFSFFQPKAKRVRREEKMLTGMQDSPLRRLGSCLEILQNLTAPNLAQEAAPATTMKGVVRATAWASQIEDVREICTSLLNLSSIMAGSDTPFSFLRPLQEQVMECVRQIASYSAVLYGVVVETVDSALSEYARERTNGQRDSTAPLLPLLVELLCLKQHAEANGECVGRWFTCLTECLVPQAFDVPVLTCNRAGNRYSWSKGVRRKSSNSRRDAPVLARNLRREEIISLSPYFRFASRLILETKWRDGAEPFLARIALLAYNVLLTQARRPNLIFGQASACYDAVAPLLETPNGVLPGGSSSGTRELCGSPTRRSGKTPDSSSSPGRKRCRSVSGGATNTGDEVFVPSPSQSPLFLEAYSSFSEAEKGRDSDGVSRGEGSPSCALTAPSWRQRLSLSAFLGLFGEAFPE
ncbi:hypothetical protein TcYC6_0050340 [Trypanosoma cruzi]|nr:hypothetical protein TcYC6_0050340 [Trypanosoma cruzi]